MRDDQTPDGPADEDTPAAGPRGTVVIGDVLVINRSPRSRPSPYAGHWDY